MRNLSAAHNVAKFFVNIYPSKKTHEDPERRTNHAVVQNVASISVWELKDMLQSLLNDIVLKCKIFMNIVFC